MTRTLPRWAAPATAFGGYAACLALLIATGWLVTYNGLSTGTLSGPDVAVAATFPAVGAVLVARRPENRIGQLLLLAGFSASMQVFGGQYAWYALHVRHGAVPGGVWMLWVSDWVWVLAFSSMALFLVLLFPTGRLPSSRWRLVAWFNGLLAVLLLLVAAFHPGHLADDPTEPVNPVGIAVLARADVVVTVLSLMALTSMLACVARLLLRFRRADVVERAQLKWFVFAASAAVTTLFLDVVTGYNVATVLDWLSAVAIGALPIAIGVAILRYRLYDIDRLISRTVSYAVITALLLAVYVGLVTSVTRLAPGGSSLAVAASTLAVAALFQPVRRRVQARVDRRFNRAQYDAERTVDAFSRRLRDEVDLGAVRADLLNVVNQTMEPAVAGIWLRDSRQVAR